MKKGAIIENIKIEKLVFGGKGFVRLDDGKVLFITGGAIPEAIVDVRITKKRKDYYEGQITHTHQKSPLETGTHDLFPGAPWMNISYEDQLNIKQGQIIESMFRLEKYQKDINFLPIVPAPEQFGYRNKVEFSFGKYISHKEEVFQDFNVGFHKRGEFSKIEDYDRCDLINEEQNEIYKKIKDFAVSSGYPVYDQKMGSGFWRHIMIRGMGISREILIVISVFSQYFDNHEDYNRACLEIQACMKGLTQSYPNIKSVYISHNDNKADTLIGELELICGAEYISEKLLGYDFDIGPKSFFQTNSLGAEILYQKTRDCYSNAEAGTVLDLYGGTGTIGMIFSDIAKDVISVELNTEASEAGARNAQKNGVTNMNFVNAKVEDFLKDYLEKGETADLLIIDPPRAGMHPSALPNILKFGTDQIIYVSCNPATLARDLEFMLANSDYKIVSVQAVDMFPHTHHIETIVSLQK